MQRKCQSLLVGGSNESVQMRSVESSVDVVTQALFSDVPSWYKECKLKHIFQEIEMFVCFGGSHGASNISKKLVGFRELWLDEMHYVSTIDG